jgi:hypothetical protein
MDHHSGVEVLHEQAVGLLAFAQRRLRPLALGEVADDDK